MHESALDMELYYSVFNGRLTFVTITHVDDFFRAYDTRCEATKALLDAIVKNSKCLGNRTTSFVCPTCSCGHRSFVHQSRNCVDLSVLPKPCCRAPSTFLSQFAGGISMVAAPIMS